MPKTDHHFQTPPIIAEYMASLISGVGPYRIIEPHPGDGNLVAAARKLSKHNDVYAPKRFENIPFGKRFDWAIMNPPFTPMAVGYQYLKDVMQITDNIIALMPWLTLINSDRRTKELIDWGLVSVTHLPRKSFPGARVQCCVMHLNRLYGSEQKEATIFKYFNW